MGDETTSTTSTGADSTSASTTSTAGSSEYSEANFLERARREPQWAADQIRVFQSKADSLQGTEDKYQKLLNDTKAVQDVIDSYDGNIDAGTVANVFNNYLKLRAAEGIGEDIMAFEQTGTLPTKTAGNNSNADDDEEYKTPEEKRMDALELELKTLRTGQTAQMSASGRQQMQNHMVTIFGEYQFPPEIEEKFRERVVKQIDDWSIQPGGEAALKALGGQNGLKTVKSIMFQDATPEDFRAANDNADLRKQQGLGPLATDGLPRAASTGKEPPPVFKDWREAARWAKANPNAHDAR